jgi:hypothetical protein
MVSNPCTGGWKYINFGKYFVFGILDNWHGPEAK